MGQAGTLVVEWSALWGSLAGLAVYIADAPCQRLELWGGDGTLHDWAQILSDSANHLHLYGKAAARPGRKMGHVTRLTL